jgi:hypothetical protein
VVLRSCHIEGGVGSTRSAHLWLVRGAICYLRASGEGTFVAPEGRWPILRALNRASGHPPLELQPPTPTFPQFGDGRDS